MSQPAKPASQTDSEAADEDLLLVQALEEYERDNESKNSSTPRPSQQYVTLDDALSLLDSTQSSQQSVQIIGERLARRTQRNQTEQSSSQNSQATSDVSAKEAKCSRKAMRHAAKSFLDQEAEEADEEEEEEEEEDGEGEFGEKDEDTLSYHSRVYDPLNPTLSDIFETTASSQSTIWSVRHGFSSQHSIFALNESADATPTNSQQQNQQSRD